MLCRPCRGVYPVNLGSTEAWFGILFYFLKILKKLEKTPEKNASFDGLLGYVCMLCRPCRGVLKEAEIAQNLCVLWGSGLCMLCIPCRGVYPGKLGWTELGSEFYFISENSKEAGKSTYCYPYDFCTYMYIYIYIYNIISIHSIHSVLKREKAQKKPT